MNVQPCESMRTIRFPRDLDHDIPTFYPTSDHAISGPAAGIDTPAENAGFRFVVQQFPNSFRCQHCVTREGLGTGECLAKLGRKHAQGNVRQTRLGFIG